jgi:BolA protein
MPSVAETLRRKLEREFSPAHINVIDESHLHVGHPGSRPGGETHFRVEIVTQVFEGLSRVERQRAVHRALADELKGRVHALSITALAPNEA